MADAKDRTRWPLRVEVAGRHLAAAPGERLLDILYRGGVLVPAACVGQGLCRLCQVQIDVQATTVALSAPNELERRGLPTASLAAGLRLACQVRVLADLQVKVLLASGS